MVQLPLQGRLVGRREQVKQARAVLLPALHLQAAVLLTPAAPLQGESQA